MFSSLNLIFLFINKRINCALLPFQKNVTWFKKIKKKENKKTPDCINCCISVLGFFQKGTEQGHMFLVKASQNFGDISFFSFTNGVLDKVIFYLIFGKLRKCFFRWKFLVLTNYSSCDFFNLGNLNTCFQLRYIFVFSEKCCGMSGKYWIIKLGSD